eukprot:13423_1
MPHVGRIPSTLEKYRHALSAYLEDITQLNFKSSSFLYFGDSSSTLYPSSTSSDESLNKCNTPIPDTKTRINHSYNTVKKQLDLLSSYFSLIHDDLHGDLLLLRTNLSLLPSTTTTNTTPSPLPSSSSSSPAPSSSSLRNNNDIKMSDDDNDSSSESKISEYAKQEQCNLDTILNTKQTQSIQQIVSILQKFIKYNSILVEYIQQNKNKISTFWVQNEMENLQTHKLNLDVESIVSTMCVKDLIHTKNSSCHNILFHDILGCANTKQFFTRIYFIVSIWYSFYHSLHLTEFHDDDDDSNNDEDDENNSNESKPCNSYLTKLFAMTEFSFLTKSSNGSGSSAASSSTSTSTSTASSPSNSDHHAAVSNANSNNNLTVSRATRARTRTRYHGGRDHSNASLSSTDRQSSGDSYNWSSTDGGDQELSFSNDSNSKNDFLLKYLNAQNNYLQSIWHDGIAFLEYSLHLLQQQEFRLSCRVAHRCLELFQKQQVEQNRIRHRQNQEENWDHLNNDLYRNSFSLSNSNNSERTRTNSNRRRLRRRNTNNPNPNGPNNAVDGTTGLFMVDPITNQPAQIPGLWYIEMHLANCYHTWGQSNMALYHINRTLDQLGNYQINPDTLTVRLNCRRKSKLLSSYLVESTQKRLKKKK